MEQPHYWGHVFKQGEEWEQKGFTIFDIYGVEPMISGANDTRRSNKKWS